MCCIDEEVHVVKVSGEKVSEEKMLEDEELGDGRLKKTNLAARELE